MSTTDFTDIVGVFRDRSQADQAIAELKQTGFAEDAIRMTEFDLPGEVEALGPSPSLQGSNKRIIVLVKAEGKEQEAVGIMVQHGANNADIPPGTTLVHGTLVSSKAETADLVPGQSNEAGSSGDLFEAAKVPGQPDETSKKDSSNMPRV